MNFLRNKIRELLVNEVLEFDRRKYLQWKRKNVTLRGIREAGQENGGMAKYGSGLYTAALSNKTMAKQYGDVHFVLNAIPKHPKVVSTSNHAEIFLQDLINNFCKKHNKSYDTTFFYETTNIAAEMLANGYDGLIIQGREMVNYTPKDIVYFKNENQLINYYETVISPQSLTEGMFNFHPKVEKLKNFIQTLKNHYQASLNIYPEKTNDSDIYSIVLGKIKIPKSKRGLGFGSKIMNDLINFANQQNVKIFLTPSDVLGGDVNRLKEFYSRFGFGPSNNPDYEMMYLPKR